MTRFLIAALALVLLSCGATHHFVPKQPIPYGQGRYSLVWNYDLNGMTMPTLWPELNMYFGVGHDFSLGMGWQILSITHLTAVKYDYRGDEDYGAGYLHLNNVFGGNNCPQIELGGSYFFISDDEWHSVALGMGIGYRPRDGHYPLYELNAKTFVLGPVNRLFPTLKYAAGTEHWAMSYIHHFGLSSTAIRPFKFYVNSSSSDPFMTIHGDSVAEITTRSGENSFKSDSMMLLMRNGNTISFRRPPPPLNCMGFDIPSISDFWLSSRGYGLYSVEVRSALGDQVVGYTTIHLRQTYRELRAGKKVTLQEYSSDIHRSLQSTNTWLSDHSIGIVFTNKVIERD